MKNWTQAIIFLLGGLLSLIGLSSALLPDAEREDERYALALRQIAHDYLLCEGDSSSRIPAVKTEADGTLLLELKRNIDYTNLAAVADDAIVRYGIRNSYSLSLRDCESGEVYLGGLWIDPLKVAAGGTGSEVACLDREQEDRCGNIILKFYTSNAVGAAGSPLALLLPGILLLLIGGWRSRSREEELPEDTLPKAESLATSELQLGENVLFDSASQKLTVAQTTYELTYRENKLMSYLVDNANELLRRDDIHDAVWGEEGIMVGRSLDVFISRLRKKMKPAEGIEIATVHGVGYRLVITA